MNIEWYARFAKQWMSIVYSPCLLLSEWFTRAVTAASSRSVSDKNIQHRHFCSLLTEIYKIINHFGVIIPIPHWISVQFPNLHRLMTTDLFLFSSVQKEYNLHQYTSDLDEGEHMTSNVPNLVFIITYLLGFYGAYEKDRNFLPSPIENDKNVLTVNPKDYLDHIQCSVPADRGNLKDPESTCWGCDFLPRFKICPAKCLTEPGIHKNNKAKSPKEDFPSISLFEFAKNVFGDGKVDENNNYLFELEDSMDYRLGFNWNEQMREALTTPVETVKTMCGKDTKEEYFHGKIYAPPKTKQAESGEEKKPKNNNLVFQYNKKDIDAHKKMSTFIYSTKEKESVVASLDEPAKKKQKKTKKGPSYDNESSHEGMRCLSINYFEKAVRALALSHCARLTEEKVTGTHMSVMNDSDQRAIFNNLAGSLFAKLEEGFLKPLIEDTIQNQKEEEPENNNDEAEKEGGMENKFDLTNAIEACFESSTEPGEFAPDPSDFHASNQIVPCDKQGLGFAFFNAVQDKSYWMDHDEFGKRQKAYQVLVTQKEKYKADDGTKSDDGDDDDDGDDADDDDEKESGDDDNKEDDSVNDNEDDNEDSGKDDDNENDSELESDDSQSKDDSDNYGQTTSQKWNDLKKQSDDNKRKQTDTSVTNGVPRKVRKTGKDDRDYPENPKKVGTEKEVSEEEDSEKQEKKKVDLEEKKVEESKNVSETEEKDKEGSKNQTVETEKDEKNENKQATEEKEEIGKEEDNEEKVDYKGDGEQEEKEKEKGEIGQEDKLTVEGKEEEKRKEEEEEKVEEISDGQKGDQGGQKRQHAAV